ncbi:unnamed protein product [Rotaria sordida]|uniref:Uncharacterized protein n=1 Tax=Rotaria sordida TaxID=392033 RepID=A0A813T3N5_9BILA|nr:unnamed protein product [Rotaria sordida]
MNEYEYYYDQYRRLPRNSLAIQRDLADYHSTVCASTYNFWSGIEKRPVTTTYIDGSSLLGLHERPYSMKGLFPKGKSRRKPSVPCEKKINTGDIFMSLVPAEKTNFDTATIRSEKTRSPLSMATATQYSTLPDVRQKNIDIRSNRIYSATIFDDDNNSEAKFYGRCATTHVNGGWVRRYKSINESQTLTDLLRDQTNRDKILPKKRSYHQLLYSSSSASAFTASLIRRRRAKC